MQKIYIFHTFKALIVIREGGICTIFTGSSYKYLGFDKVSKVYHFMQTKSHYSSTVQS